MAIRFIGSFSEGVRDGAASIEIQSDGTFTGKESFNGGPISNRVSKSASYSGTWTRQHTDEDDDKYILLFTEFKIESFPHREHANLVETTHALSVSEPQSPVFAIAMVRKAK